MWEELFSANVWLQVIVTFSHSQDARTDLLSMRKSGIKVNLKCKCRCCWRASKEVQENQTHCSWQFCTGETNELYIEIVPGLGETLVGNSPGSAFRCSIKKDAFLQEATKKEETKRWLTVVGLPSKSEALYASLEQQQRLIFRSDSNAEDLPG